MEQESLRGKTVGEIISGLISGNIKFADVKADIPSISETFDTFLEYIGTINWKEEYWLQAWFVFCIFVLILIIAKRKNSTFITCAFLITNFSAFLASIFNSLGAKYWEMFSTQPYFDKEGAFISLVYTTPLIILSFVLLLLLVFNLATTMVELKKRKLVIEMKKKKKEKEEAPTGNGGNDKKDDKQKKKPGEASAKGKKKDKKD